MSFYIAQTECCIQVPQERSTPALVETYDFVIVGAGHAGSVLARRLSQNGRYSVCVLEAGRDDARLPPLLPLPSDGNVPQPGSFNWGTYIRTIGTVAPLESRGFLNEWFFLKQSADPSSRSISYPRVFGWGGCTSHNRCIAVRNPPYNWDSWGLPEYRYNAIKDYYKLTENRSQQNNGFIYYNPAIPSGHQGSSHPDYGVNGTISLLWNVNTSASPLLAGVNSAVQYLAANIPLNVDLDNPDTAGAGGTSLGNYSMFDQYASFQPSPGASVTPFSTYNQTLYGDSGYVYPPELAPFGLSGKAPTQRSGASNAYLYPALASSNLTVKSEVLVTRILTSTTASGLQATGVEYCPGWNIYQAGRNLSIERGGYGGTPGDARANFLEASPQRNFALATKEVILCGGVINSAQLMLLSGIGPTADLQALGITPVLSSPVGQELNDNPELFPFWETTTNFKVVGERVFVSVKSDPSRANVDFDIGLNSTTLQSMEAEDVTIQYGFGGTKNLGALDNQFTRNAPGNVLLDPVAAGNPYVYSPQTFQPIYTSPLHRMCMLIEQVFDVASLGTLKLRSSDPTVPPHIVANYLGVQSDVTKWVNVWMDTILPMLLGFSADVKASAFTTSISGVPDVIQVPAGRGGLGNRCRPLVLVNGSIFPSAVCNLDRGGAVTSITMNVGGYGYANTTPTVFFYGGGATTQASATATVVNGVVTAITMVSGGTGYRSPPLVMVLGTFADGTLNSTVGATATVVGGVVTGVTINGVGLPGTVMIDFGYYFNRLLDPAPYDILRDGVTSFTSMADVDVAKLTSYIKSRAGGHHAGGTCKMGLPGDPTAVVDQKGLVYGMTGLRVCDMSIVPVAIRWPNSTLYVVAEKIAADILAKYA